MTKVSPILADFDLSDMGEIIGKANKRFSENEARSFRRTVQTWETKPKFSVQSKGKYYGIEEFSVFTFSEVYFWVNSGTKPHTIRPKSPNTALSYQKDFTPKTRVGFIESGKGGKSGDFITRGGVSHPGIEARDFVGQIKEKARDRWANAVNTEIKKWLKKTIK